MFYYPTVLQRHTGCFATIWLAATGATKLVKREYLKVNVPRTCEDIMAYILVRVPPPAPGAPRPRFSLYLSAQLQYGVVLIYNRQCQYLIEEIQNILERLNRAQQQIRIDLTDLEQPGLLLPDQMALMELLEEAPDPFFGMMEPALPSPVLIPHVRAVLEAATPGRSSQTQPFLSPYGPRAGETPLTVAPEAITLKEAEPITLLRIEDEQDLPEITAQEIDLLVEQEGFLVPGEEKLLPLPHVSPRKRRAEEESVEKIREQELLLSLGLSPPTRVGDERSATRETGLLLSDEAQLPSEVAPAPLEMTPLAEQPSLLPPPRSPSVSPRADGHPPLSPELRLPDYEPSPARPPRRRRQLRFVDPVTQISRDDYQKQILDPRTQCQPLESVLLPSKRLKTPAELFGAPTYGWLHPTLRGLWIQGAKSPQVDYAKQRTLRAQKKREETQRAEAPSEPEELRAAEEPSMPPTVSSEISLETTEEESRPSLVIPEERVLLEPEEVALPVVPELPEISFEMPLDKETVTLDYMQRFLLAKLQQDQVILFEQLVPSTTSRAVASRFFYACLVLGAAQFLRLEQKEPYGPMVITPGAHFKPRS